MVLVDIVSLLLNIVGTADDSSKAVELLAKADAQVAAHWMDGRDAKYLNKASALESMATRLGKNYTFWIMDKKYAIDFVT